jgi:hypothetical protein
MRSSRTAVAALVLVLGACGTSVGAGGSGQDAGPSSTDASLEGASLDGASLESASLDGGSGDDASGDGDASSDATCSGGAVAEQEFAPGVSGCAGKVTFDKAQSLCAAPCTVCSAQEWANTLVPQIGGNTPKYDYWVTGATNWSGSGPGSCAARAGGGGGSCGSRAPMRICVDNGASWNGADPLGNTCAWDDCALEDSSANAFLGGCGSTAGALCCCPWADGGASVQVDASVQADPCAGSAVAEQVFAPGISGCAGKVTFDNALSLCASGFAVCSAREWASAVVPQIGSNNPQYDYWVTGAPNFSGTATQSCAAWASAGTACQSSNTPMRVCVDTGTTDALGNTCYWYGCGFEAASPNAFMGGCNGNLTAGTLCCTPALADGGASGDGAAGDGG